MRRVCEFSPRVKELDYRPNLTARSLVTGRSYLVGLVVSDLLHPFFAEVAKSLSDVLRGSGYYLTVCSSNEDLSRRPRDGVSLLLCTPLNEI